MAKDAGAQRELQSIKGQGPKGTGGPGPSGCCGQQACVSEWGQPLCDPCSKGQSTPSSLDSKREADGPARGGSLQRPGRGQAGEAASGPKGAPPATLDMTTPPCSLTEVLGV